MLPEPQPGLKKQQTNNQTKQGQEILPDPSVLVTLSDITNEICCKITHVKLGKNISYLTLKS